MGFQIKAMQGTVAKLPQIANFWPQIAV